MDRRKEHHIKFVAAGEHSWDAVDTAEWTFDTVPRHRALTLPGEAPVLPGSYHGDEAEVQVQWAGFIALANPVRAPLRGAGPRSRQSQWLASVGDIVSRLKSFTGKRSR